MYLLQVRWSIHACFVSIPEQFAWSPDAWCMYNVTHTSWNLNNFDIVALLSCTGLILVIFPFQICLGLAVMRMLYAWFLIRSQILQLFFIVRRMLYARLHLIIFLTFLIYNSQILALIRQKLLYKELQEKNPKENLHPTMCFSSLELDMLIFSCILYFNTWFVLPWL